MTHSSSTNAERKALNKMSLREARGGKEAREARI
jgi:hypothetical protein